MFRVFSSHRSAWYRSLRIGLAVLTLAYGLGGFPASTNPNIPDHLNPGVQQAHADSGGDGVINSWTVNRKPGGGYAYSKSPDCPDVKIGGTTYYMSRDTESRLCVSSNDIFDPDSGQRSCRPGNLRDQVLEYHYSYYFRPSSGSLCVIKRRYHDQGRSRYCPTNEVFYSTRGCRCPPDKPDCGPPPPPPPTVPGGCLRKAHRLQIVDGTPKWVETDNLVSVSSEECANPTPPSTPRWVTIETDQTEVVEGETVIATVNLVPSSPAHGLGQLWDVRFLVGGAGSFAKSEDDAGSPVVQLAGDNLALEKESMYLTGRFDSWRYAPVTRLNGRNGNYRAYLYGKRLYPNASYVGLDPWPTSFIAERASKAFIGIVNGKRMYKGWGFVSPWFHLDADGRGTRPGVTWSKTPYYVPIQKFRIEIPTDDDNVAEDDGTITITLPQNDHYSVLDGDEKEGDYVNRSNTASVTVKVLDNDAPKTTTTTIPPKVTVSVTSDQSVSGVTEGPYVYATASVRVSPPVPVGETVTVPVTVSETGDVVYESASNTGQRSVVLRPTSSPLGSAEVKVLIHDDLVDEPPGAVTFSLGQPRAGPGSRVVYKLGTPRSVTVPVFDNDCPSGQHRYAGTCHDDHPRGCVASGVGFYRDHRNGDLDDHYNAPKPVCACPSGQHRHGTAACTQNHLLPACSPDRDTNYYVHVNGAHVQRSIQQCACAHTATGEPQHRHTVGHRTDNQCHMHPRPACLAANPREYWRIPVSGRRDDGRHDTFTLAACACPSGEHRHGSSGACHDHTPPLCSLEGQSFHTHTSGDRDATDVRDGYVAACPGELPKIKRVGTIRVGESANNAIIRVELNKPVRAGEIGIIRVETVNGTATPNADYKLIRGDDLRVNVGAGERSAVVRIPIVDDTEVEDDENFTVILEAFGDLRRTRRIARVVIIDDDTPPDTTIEAVSPRVVEGEQVSFVVQLSRTYKDTLRVRVRVRESGDMLTRKADERVHEVRIRPGSTAGYLTLRTQDDQTNEKASNITAVIQNPVTRNLPRYQYNVGTPARSAVRVVDNDRPPPVIGLSSDSAQITEGDTITLKASMLSTRDSDIDVRVNIGETSFAAEAGQTTGDHLQPGWETQHTISIPAGSVSATKVVQTTDDTTDEADSTVTAAVQTHPTYLGTPDTQTVVQDNDNRYNKQTCAEQGKDYDDRLDECFVGFPR